MTDDSRMKDPSMESLSSVDMDLYSRQVGTYGLETMTKLVQAKYLICGLQGVGAEIAKNLILAGPAQVTLSDQTVVDIADLGSNFALSHEDVGKKSRAAASLPFLSTLNPYVAVNTSDEVVPSEESLQLYDCAIFCNYSKKNLEHVNRLCRQHNVAFIAVGVYGLCSSIFVDFGPNFQVNDEDGEPARHHIIESITYTPTPSIAPIATATATATSSSPILQVNCVDVKRMTFTSGMRVRFEGVQAFGNGLSSDKTFMIESVSKYGFSILLDPKTSNFSASQQAETVLPEGGSVVEVKQSKRLQFQPYDVACASPVPPGADALISVDFAKIGRAEQLHIALQALTEFEAMHKSLPETRNPNDAAQVLELALNLNARMKQLGEEKGGEPKEKAALNPFLSVEEVDKGVVKNVAYFAACMFQPMATFVGGVAAQEAIKITGKYHPIFQWLYYDCFELIASDADSANASANANANGSVRMDPEEYTGVNSQYDDLIAIWGRKMQSKLAQLNIFLVGAGALGCEYAKNLALLGCCTGSLSPDKTKGRLTITDMDKIETSNLNRQFLFRREHVGQSKSLVAGAVVQKVMSRNLNVTAYEAKVGPETERELFTEKFWQSLDVVVNGLDNIPSRLYVDSKCVWFETPLVESGTLGVKGNVQPIVPHVTESYADSRDPPEESIPLCTLRHFPTQIEHTLEWARDYFHGAFFDAVMLGRNFIAAPDAAYATLVSQSPAADVRAKLETVDELVAIAQAPDPFLACVHFALSTFYKLFNFQILQLTHSYPEHTITGDGVPFWSGSKRFPRPLDFSAEEPQSSTFIVAATQLCAYALNLVPSSQNASSSSSECTIFDRATILEQAKNVAQAIPAFEPKNDVKIKANEDDQVVEGASDDTVVAKALKEKIQAVLATAAKATDRPPIQFRPIEFEKDDDSNYHIDFIVSAGNLRAMNYKIDTVDRWQGKIIAGKIIPAVASTTAMITGLGTIEFLKMVLYPGATLKAGSNSSGMELQKRPIDHYKSAFVSLAGPQFILSEPGASKRTRSSDYDPIALGPVKARPEGFTTWDKTRVEIKCDATLANLIDASRREIGDDFEVMLVSVGAVCIYNSYLPTHKNRLALPLAQAIAAATAGDPTSSIETNLKPGMEMAVQFNGADEDGIDLLVPQTRVVLV